MSTSDDLWPAEIATEDIRPPVAILRQQASKLGPKTGNLVEAKVKSYRSAGNGFVHMMLIVAPSMDYQYELFRIYHGIDLYPLRIEPSIPLNEQEAADEAEFIDIVEEILQHPKTTHIINVLLSQIQSETKD